MAKIISVNRVSALGNYLQKSGKTIVLAGGCFDILHPGHEIFLEKAKKVGDYLVVLLESDEKIKLLKGPKRPIHTQKERAEVLSALTCVDYVVMLSFFENDNEYDQLIAKIKPDIIAVTKGGEYQHQKRVAELVGAELKFVTKIVGNYSTSRILNH